MNSLERRVASLENKTSFAAFLESLTDGELLAIAGDGEFEGVKMCELSDADLDVIINSESESVAREILETYKEKRGAQ